MNPKLLGSLLVGIIVLTGVYIGALSLDQKQITDNIVDSQLAQVSAPSSGLISHWKFDEGSGSTISASVGGGSDTLGNPSWTTGKIGSALNFNGSDYVGVGNVSPSKITISAWIKPTNNPNYGSVVMKQFTYGLETQGSKVYAGIGNGSAWANGSTGGGYLEGNLSLDSWQLVTQTYDGKTNRLYINGKLVSSGSATLSIGSAPFLIGAWDTAFAEPFMGAVDDVRIYNRALSASEVSTLYAYNGAVADTAGPTISNLKVSNILTDRVTLTWDTNELSDTFVEFGVTTSYSNTSTLKDTGANMVTSHTQIVAGLQANTFYNYRVTSKDAAGNVTRSSNGTFTTVSTADTIPPSAPTNLQASNISQTGVNLSWTASTDNIAVTGYRVYRNSTEIPSGSSNSYLDSGLTPGTSYSYAVAAVDAAGNVSAKSTARSIKTLSPSPTATLSASVSSIISGQSVILTWSSTNATACTATGGTFTGQKGLSGSQAVAPTVTTTYALSCTGTGGTVSAAPITVTVAVPPAPTVTFSASASTITSGQSVTLNWVSTNATACTATGGMFAGSKGISGAQTIAPTGTATYGLSCTGAGGTTSASPVTVTVNIPQTSNLLSYWAFNQTSGTTATDSSGNNKTATLIGSPTWTTGVAGNGLQFNGTSAYLNAGTVSVSSFTISTWVNMSASQSGWGSLVMKQNSFGLEVQNGTVYANVGNGSTWTNTVNAPLTAGTWKHVVQTFNGSTNTNSIYVDGVLRASGTGTFTNSASNLLIGSWNGSSEFFNGKIDEVRVYNSALTATEISALYNSVTLPTGTTVTATVTKAGTGAGTTTCNPTSCSSTTGSVTITATPTAGSTFTGWSGACTGTGTCTIASSASVTATFTLIPVTGGTTVYIRSGATGNGTDWTNALPALPSTLTRGYTYYIADGTYGSYTFDDAVSGTQLITVKKATATDHGTNTGWVSTYGDGRAELGALTFSTDYYVVDGQKGSGSANLADRDYGFYIKSGGTIISSDGSANYITIKRMEIEGTGRDAGTAADTTWPSNKGFYLSGTHTNWIVSNIYLHDTGNMSFQWASLSNSVVENSYIARNESSSAAHAEGVYGFGSNNTIRNNVWEDIEGTGVIMISGSGWKVYNNVMFWTPTYAGGGTGNGAVADWSDSSTASAAANNLIYSNTIINQKGYSSGFNFIHTGSTGNIASNNLRYLANSSSNTTGSNNIIAPTDPFVNWQARDFRLNSSSGAINAGATLGSEYAVDLVGTVRPQGSAFDAGAYEFTGTVTNPPSTKFSANERVATTDILNVRSAASASATLLGSQALGALGTVTGGGTSADGYYWWNINYDTGVDGWSVENYLVKYTAPTTFTVTTAKAGTGSGTVTCNPTSCAANTGSTVTVTAAPSAGSTFVGWSGACSGTGSCTVTSAGTVTATFNLIPATGGTTVNVTPSTWGSLTFVRGNIYVLAPGTYTAKKFTTPVSGSTYITIKSDGTGQASFNGTMHFATDYWILDGVTRNESDWFSGSSYGFRVYGAAQQIRVGDPDNARAVSNVKIRNTYLQASQGLSNTVSPRWYGLDIVQYTNTGGISTGIEVSRSFFQYGNVPIWAQNNRSMLVEYTAFDANESTSLNHGEPISCYYDGNCSDSIVRFNKFRSSSGTAIVALGGGGTVNNFQFYGNTIWNADIGDGILGFSEATRSNFTNSKVYNNSIANKRSGYSNGVAFMTGSNNLVYNNVWYNTPGIWFGSAVTQQNNIVNPTTDPFVNSTAGDLRLKTSLGAGTTLAAPYNVDVTGAIRGADGVWDIGAHEFSGSVSTTCTQTLSTGANVASAVSSAVAGSTICLNSGNYGVVNFTDIAKTGRVTVKSASGVGAQMSPNFSNSDYIRLESMTLSNASISRCSTNIQIVGNTWVQDTGGISVNDNGFGCDSSNKNILIDGNTMIMTRATGGEGKITLTSVNGVTITKNLIQGQPGANLPSGSKTGGDGIQTAGSVNNIIIGPGNIFRDILQAPCGSDPVRDPHCDSIQIVDSVSNANIVVNGNWFDNVEVTLQHHDWGTAPVKFTNNLVTNSRHNWSYGTPANNYLIDHNTFYNQGDPNWGAYSVNSTGMNFRNNIVINSENPKLCPGCSASYNLGGTTGQAIGTNAIVGTPTFVGGSVPTTWAGWQLAVGSLGKGNASDGLDRGTNYFGQ